MGAPGNGYAACGGVLSVSGIDSSVESLIFTTSAGPRMGCGSGLGCGGHGSSSLRRFSILWCLRWFLGK